MSFNRFAVLQDQSSRQQTNKRNNQTKKQSTGPTHRTPTPGDRARKREEKNTTTTESPQKPNKPIGKTLPKNLEEENSKTFIKVESKKPKNEGDDQKTLSKTDFVNERKKGNTPQNQRKNNDGQRRPNRNNNNEVDGQRQGQGQKRGPGGNPQKRGQGQGKGAKKNPGKRNTRAPDSLNNPEGKRTGRGQPPVYNKKVKDNDVKPLWNEEQPTEDVINKDENVDNEKENVNVEQEDSESSEYYIEGNLIEDPKENKLVDAPLNKEKEAVKAKGFKKYLEEKEAQKESLAKLLEKQGLESKTEIPVPEVKVESLNRKEQTLVIENESDLFFVKKDNQTESKKKEKKQQTGPKTVKVSEVFIVKQRRHRGFNTVPSEKPRVFDNNKEKTGTTQTGESSPKTDSPKEKRDNRNYQDRNQGQYRKGPNTGRGRGYKQNVGTKVGNLQDTNQYPSLSNGDVQPLKQWGPEDKN